MRQRYSCHSLKSYDGYLYVHVIKCVLFLPTLFPCGVSDGYDAQEIMLFLLPLLLSLSYCCESNNKSDGQVGSQ